MKRKWLKIARVVVSVTVFAAATVLWLGIGSLSVGLGWVTKLQVLPMALTVSVSMVAFWLLVAWLFGRVYCSSVCPLGTWLDIVARIGRSTRRGWKAEYHYSTPYNRWRYGWLMAVVACFLCNLAIIPALVEPYSLYSQWIVRLLRPLAAPLGIGVNSTSLSVSAIVLAAVTFIAVSITAWRSGRLYCNTVCPIGTVLGLCSRQSIWRIDIDTDLCTNCRACEHVCKAQCIDLTDHVVDGSRCVNCFDCIAVCRDNAIFYRPTRKQLSLPMMQRVDTPRIATADTASGPCDTINKSVDDETIS